MKSAVILAVHPVWCYEIFHLICTDEYGRPVYKKTIEVRKSKPKCDVPFKVYIYCTKGKVNLLKTIDGSCFLDDSYTPNDNLYGLYHCLNGTVIGEFVCDEIIEIMPDNEIYGTYDISDDEVIASCLVNGDLWDYGKGKTLYGWHISNLVIYDKPKELSDFYVLCNRCDKRPIACKFAYEESNESVGYYSECLCDFKRPMERPPQSWCYVY